MGRRRELGRRTEPVEEEGGGELEEEVGRESKVVEGTGEKGAGWKESKLERLFCLKNLIVPPKKKGVIR